MSDSAKSQREQVAMAFGYAMIGLLMVGMIGLMSWLYLRQRDLFVVMMSLLLFAGALVVLGVTVHKRKTMEKKTFEIILYTILALVLINLLNMVLFIIRFFRVRSEKTKAMSFEMPPMEP